MSDDLFTNGGHVEVPHAMLANYQLHIRQHAFTIAVLVTTYKNVIIQIHVITLSFRI